MDQDVVRLARETELTQFRNKIRDIGADVLKLKSEYAGRVDEFPGQNEEMIANVVLAYRHLEDARMRIGKVMQQLQGGVSIFDKPEQEKAETNQEEPGK